MDKDHYRYHFEQIVGDIQSRAAAVRKVLPLDYEVGAEEIRDRIKRDNALIEELVRFVERFIV